MAHGKNAEKYGRGGLDYYHKRGYLHRPGKAWMCWVCACNKFIKRLTAKAERRQDKEIVEEQSE